MITLQGNPKSTQHIYKISSRGKYATMYMTAEGKTLKETYKWEMMAQYKGKPDITEVEIGLYFGDRRKRDIDNFNKLILDAGTGILWEDDSQITKLTITKHYCKENPRIELII